MKRRVFVQAGALAGVRRWFVFGQPASATLTGEVRDSSGATIAAASIVTSNVDTGLKRTTVSNDDGAYAIAMLPPGSYRITVQKDGFRPAMRSGIRLKANQAARVDFVMVPGPGRVVGRPPNVVRKGFRTEDTISR